ncbi:hypothetical protein PENSTE_c010G02577 [Penicillium steckii]|uniref:BTB domain-containing protein n=1 Tax=Penicillium steckii TaxID=303698 RepID=A0A1V6T7W6_9EURO|nr:hypothetical protein PENSTE_c010G02577 [Penicillium steckii]
MSYRTKKAPGPPKFDPKTPEDNQQAQRDIIYNLVANMHLNPDFSDLTIICKGREFAAHKLVVCQRSEHLNALCKNLQDSSKPLVINREPVLIEKTLEFLYQADYKVSNVIHTKDSRNSKTPRQTAVVSDLRAFKKAQSAKMRALKETTATPTDPQTEEIYEDTRKDWSDQMEDDLAVISAEEQDDEVVDEDGVNILGDDDPFLKECHPSYFHARMYGEGDCLRIQDLKAKAICHFEKTFMDNPDAKSFSKTIEEIYSNRAVYIELRKSAVRLIVQNLKILWHGTNPVLNQELIKSVPEFTSDLLLSILDLCALKNIFVQLQVADKKPAEVVKKSLKTEISKRA